MSSSDAAATHADSDSTSYSNILCDYRVFASSGVPRLQPDRGSSLLESVAHRRVAIRSSARPNCCSLPLRSAQPAAKSCRRPMIACRRTARLWPGRSLTRCRKPFTLKVLSSIRGSSGGRTARSFCVEKSVVGRFQPGDGSPRRAVHRKHQLRPPIVRARYRGFDRACSNVSQRRAYHRRRMPTD